MIVQLLQIILSKGAGDALIRSLADYVAGNGEGAAKELFQSTITLIETFKVKEEVANSIFATKNEAEILRDKLVKNSVEMFWIGGRNYPERLKFILAEDAPAYIFVKGNTKLLDMKAVGFCGSRKASDKGIEITSRCSEQLVKNDYCVVSGYAHGVDMASHKTALELGGNTIFVLVDGILRYREKTEVKGLLTNENHLVVSQFTPRLTWIGRNAMKRNATIIGLSDAMILVESGLTGGTFAAGEETLKRKRPLFVIDYAAPGPSAEANPYFIEKGGKPIRGKQGIPNLTEVFNVAQKPSWRSAATKEISLFNWKSNS